MPQHYGAIADGKSHPVSEWLVGEKNDKGYPNLAAIQVDYPHVKSLSDEIDWAAIQKVCDIAFHAKVKRNSIFFPNGNYSINQTITTGHEVPLIGESRSSAMITATANFPEDTWMIEANRGGIDYQHNNGLWSISLNANNIADYGYWAWNVNEHGGLYDVEIKNFRKIGARFAAREGKPDPVINYMIQNVHIVTSHADADAIGIHVGAGNNHPLLVQKGTIILSRQSGVDDGIGILLNSGDVFQARITDFHFEHCEDGIRVDHGRAIIENCEGWVNVENTVHFTSGCNFGVAKLIINKNLKKGKCIKDSGVLVDEKPLRVGGPFYSFTYANKRAKGMGAIRSFVVESEAEIAHEYHIPHQYEAKPDFVNIQVMSEGGEIVELIGVEKDYVKCKVYNLLDRSYSTGKRKFHVMTEF